MPIATTLQEMFDDEIEVYWLAKGFCSNIRSFEKEMPKLLDIFRTMLEKEDCDVYKYV